MTGMIHNTMDISRRRFTTAMAGAGLAATVPASAWLGSARQAGAQEVVTEALVIDLDGELESIHPSLAYSPRDWSIVNSIYDSILYIDSAGQVVPLAAESFETDDAITFSVTLRAGIAFHDGTPVNAEILRGSWEFLMNSGSSAVDVFRVITDVEVTGELDATIICDAPAPWLPAQIATWLKLVPPGYTDEQALRAPNGTGPYTLATYDQGQDVELERYDGYQLADVKGEALAESVTFRIVPDAATRVADVVTGTANIVDNIPEDFREELVNQGVSMLTDPIVGSQWIRIATDVEPFDDPGVRQALNYAVDRDTIVEALLGSEVRPLGSIFPDERAPGYLGSIEPYPYAPDRARELLSAAGVEEGSELRLEITQSARKDIAEVIAANLQDVGFVVEVVTSDLAAFNAGWSDPERPVLRMATWTPLYEPHTLLDLVFKSDGFLSRYSNEEFDALLEESATEGDTVARRAILESLNQLMHEDPPVIFLWNLTATYGVDGTGLEWSPMGNSQIVPTSN